jgi:hypothetical protein
VSTLQGMFSVTELIYTGPDVLFGQLPSAYHSVTPPSPYNYPPSCFTTTFPLVPNLAPLQILCSKVMHLSFVYSESQGLEPLVHTQSSSFWAYEYGDCSLFVTPSSLMQLFWGGPCWLHFKALICSIVTVKSAYFSERLVPIYQTTRCHISKCCNFNIKQDPVVGSCDFLASWATIRFSRTSLLHGMNSSGSG